jgi:hypothetical protein
VSSPFEIAEFDIMFGDGINNLGCVFDVAKDLGVLEARVRGTTCSTRALFDTIAAALLLHT